MGAVTKHPITIQEFDMLDLPKDRKWELHNGKLVEVSFASLIHNDLQHRLQDLLGQAFPGAIVRLGYAFQIEETNDKRSADVALTTQERHRAARPNGILSGAPELVVEVLSPSNTILGLRQFQQICFDHGTKVFLIVDPEDNAIEVYLEPGKQHDFLKTGSTLHLSRLGTEACIPVAGIFAGITLPDSA
jgi:Uma2 family endonuclease